MLLVAVHFLNPPPSQYNHNHNLILENTNSVQAGHPMIVPRVLLAEKQLYSKEPAFISSAKTKPTTNLEFAAVFEMFLRPMN